VGGLAIAHINNLAHLNGLGALKTIAEDLVRLLAAGRRAGEGGHPF
jgi:hypothetical protein